MAELTNAQLRQIHEALRISVEYLPDNEDLTTVNAALDMVTTLLEVPAKVEAAPAAAKAKLLTPTQMNLARRMDGEASVYVPYGSVLYRTAKPMWTKGLIEIVEKSNLGNYYGLTEKGYEALRETAIANRS